MIPACQWREDCQDDDHIARIHADPTFSDEEQEGILRAADRWNTFTNHIVILVQVRSTHLFTCNIINSSKEDVGDGKNYEGVERNATGNIEIASSFNCNGEPRARELVCFEAIVMHEMGHLLGFAHLPPGVDGIMRGSGGASLDFTDGDRRACESLGLCR